MYRVINREKFTEREREIVRVKERHREKEKDSSQYRDIKRV